VGQIKTLLDTRVRPAVAQDGGDITFHGFDRGVVYLHMQGACAGCPSSTMTLKMGIENLLRHYIPEVLEVRPVASDPTLPRLRHIGRALRGRFAVGEELVAQRGDEPMAGQAERLMPLLASRGVGRGAASAGAIWRA
jgi:Fe-S cluster biogenesis protein NfuA